MNKWYIPLLSITFDKVKKKTQNRTHISCLLGIPILPTLSKKKKNQEPSPDTPEPARDSLQHIPNPILHRLAPSFSLRILTIHLGVTHLQEKAKNEAEQDGDSRHGRVGCECSLHIQHQFPSFKRSQKKRETTYGVSRSVGRRVEVWWPDLGNVTLWFRFWVSHLEALKLIHYREKN